MTTAVPDGDSRQRHRAAVGARLLRADHERAGPGSITWKVNREVVAVAGWGRAILLQLAYPAVAAGVHDHSAFRGSLRSSFRRLHATVGAMLSITFGDTEQMITAAAGINAIHDRVRGRVRERSGEAYSAHDPELQRWVHAALLESIPLAYERLIGPLTPRERDRYCAEAAIMEPLLGMPAGWLPRDSAQLDTYMREMLAGGSLVVTDASRALARAVLYPPRWWVAWPAFRAMQLLTIGSLPPAIRQAYGFEWRARDARAFARWTALLRTSRRLIPSFAREWPMARRLGPERVTIGPMRNRILVGVLACLAGITLLAQADLGPPRWMPVDPMSESRRTADDLAAEKHLLALVERIKALPALNPVPGVYPKASLSSAGTSAPAPYWASLMVGFWPPTDTRLTNGVLRPAGALAHLMIYMNWVREAAMDKTFWKDAEGPLYPQPQQLGDVQGFPVYEGFGSAEVSGILIVQPPGRQLFTPVTRQRFHAFAVADLERQMRSATAGLKSAQAKHAASTSAAGAAAREKQIVMSLAQYQSTRARTPEQMVYREQEIRRLDAEEIERQRLDAALETNRLTGPLTVALGEAKAALAALTPGDQSSPACHLPDSRNIGPHPVPIGTPGCRPIVSMARWYNPSLPRTTPQLLSIERYWMSARETKTFGDQVRAYYRLNAATVESLDWKAISTTFLK